MKLSPATRTLCALITTTALAVGAVAPATAGEPTPLPSTASDAAQPMETGFGEPIQPGGTALTHGKAIHWDGTWIQPNVRSTVTPSINLAGEAAAYKDIANSLIKDQEWSFASKHLPNALSINPVTGVITSQLEWGQEWMVGNKLATLSPGRMPVDVTLKIILDENKARFALLALKARPDATSKKIAAMLEKGLQDGHITKTDTLVLHIADPMSKNDSFIPRWARAISGALSPGQKVEIKRAANDLPVSVTGFSRSDDPRYPTPSWVTVAPDGTITIVGPKEGFQAVGSKMPDIWVKVHYRDGSSRYVRVPADLTMGEKPGGTTTPPPTSTTNPPTSTTNPPTTPPTTHNPPPSTNPEPVPELRYAMSSPIIEPDGTFRVPLHSNEADGPSNGWYRATTLSRLDNGYWKKTTGVTFVERDSSGANALIIDPKVMAEARAVYGNAPTSGLYYLNESATGAIVSMSLKTEVAANGERSSAVLGPNGSLIIRYAPHGTSGQAVPPEKDPGNQGGAHTDGTIDSGNNNPGATPGTDEKHVIVVLNPDAPAPAPTPTVPGDNGSSSSGSSGDNGTSILISIMATLGVLAGLAVAVAPAIQPYLPMLLPPPPAH